MRKHIIPTIGFFCLLMIIISSSWFVIREVRTNRFTVLCLAENGGNFNDCRRRLEKGEPLP